MAGAAANGTPPMAVLVNCGGGAANIGMFLVFDDPLVKCGLTAGGLRGAEGGTASAGR